MVVASSKMKRYTGESKLPYCTVCKCYIYTRDSENPKDAVERHIRSEEHKRRVGPRPHSTLKTQKEMRGEMPVIPEWLRKKGRS